MNKRFLLAAVIIIIGLGIQSVALESSIVDPVGTWSYKAPSAPEGYGSGDIVIARSKEVYSATLKLGDYEIKATGVTYEKEVLSFKVFIEGESVSVKATFTAETCKGTASYSEGDLPFTGTKKTAKK